ncbi:MAG: hypothetical protein ABI114_08710 [Rhodanobacter sp.]
MVLQLELSGARHSSWCRIDESRNLSQIGPIRIESDRRRLPTIISVLGSDYSVQQGLEQVKITQAHERDFSLHPAQGFRATQTVGAGANDDDV